MQPDLGYPTQIDVRGDGPVTVLVHGTPLDRRAWEAFEATPFAAGRRLVAYDLRGHGSAAGTPLPADYGVLSADLLRLLDALGAECAHVVGHSFGGQVVARFALDHPERTASLSIVCARLVPHPPFAQAADVVAAQGPAAVADASIARWFSPEAVAADAPPVRYARACLVDADRDALATALRMISTFAEADALAALDVPARIVAAARDQVATPPELEALAARMPRCDFTLVEGGAHMLPLEHPRRVAELLAAPPRG